MERKAEGRTRRIQTEKAIATTQSELNSFGGFFTHRAEANFARRGKNGRYRHGRI